MAPCRQQLKEICLVVQVGELLCFWHTAIHVIAQKVRLEFSREICYAGNSKRVVTLDPSRNLLCRWHTAIDGIASKIPLR